MKEFENNPRLLQSINKLNRNPHFLQMVEILAQRPDLLKRVEANDLAAIQETSELAYLHFLMMLETIDVDSEPLGIIKENIISTVYHRLKNG